MQYISTRGKAPALGFEDTMLSGLARDGGLYVPETIPTLSAGDIRAMHRLSYEEIAFRVMRPFVDDAFTDEVFADLMQSFDGCAQCLGFGHVHTHCSHSHPQHVPAGSDPAHSLASDLPQHKRNALALRSSGGSQQRG